MTGTGTASWPLIVRAGAGAAVLSGLPSTTWAVVRRGDPLEAARAASTVLPGCRDRPGLVAGMGVHMAVSAAWTLVLGAAARRVSLGPLSGAVAGLLIATIDLGVVAPRCFPKVAALPQAPQWADHVAFGLVFSWLAEHH